MALFAIRVGHVANHTLSLRITKTSWLNSDLSVKRIYRVHIKGEDKGVSEYRTEMMKYMREQRHE